MRFQRHKDRIAVGRLEGIVFVFGRTPMGEGLAATARVGAANGTGYGFLVVGISHGDVFHGHVREDGETELEPRGLTFTRRRQWTFDDFKRGHHGRPFVMRYCIDTFIINIWQIRSIHFFRPIPLWDVRCVWTKFSGWPNQSMEFVSGRSLAWPNFLAGPTVRNST